MVSGLHTVERLPGGAVDGRRAGHTGELRLGGSIRFGCPKAALGIELSSRGCQRTGSGLEPALLRSLLQLARQVSLQEEMGQLQSLPSQKLSLQN